MAGITKRFGSVVALESVDLHVEAQTIHAVVGENGAGKTTLMRILYGALKADSGVYELNGQLASFGSTKQAIAHGIGMVSQHYAIIPELTALENLTLGAEGGVLLNKGANERIAEELATRMGFRFDWNRPAAELSPAGAQKLEILKLLWRRAQIMILDEPTAMLSPADGDALFESLHKLVREGATVILVTHRLPEVLDHCKSVTVLRGGMLIEEKGVSQTSARELARLIIGGDLPEHELRAVVAPGEPVLELENVSATGDRGHEALKGVSLSVRSGEIVGVAGVDGSGQRELFQAIAGLTKSTGRLAFGGSSTSARLRAGLRIIPEDRHHEGVIESWSLDENSALGLQRLAPLAKGRSIDVAARRKWSQAVADRFKTKHGGLNLPMASLSGGNQQRFVAARAIGFEPKLLLAFQPARGLDLGSTVDVYRGIRQTCDSGAGALVVSFDLDELLEHCDRIVVMNNGRLVEAGSKDRDQIGRLMVGAE
ncbi:MAG TPA: ABC transporter ATP-binding protein [Fimbriimonas sp.]|nr:ABC transporter ATP-binding protein [Fimbriimonas sp.]